MGITTKQRNYRRAAMDNSAPKVSHDNKGWRVDMPDGDFCYQPSEQFAISYARQWNEDEKRN